MLFSIVLLLMLAPAKSMAAVCIFVGGSGTKTVGQTFNAVVSASGVEFDSLQGTINVSGNVSVVSVSAGSATWLPGKTPAVGSQFVGITSPTSSLTVATVRLRATAEGSGSVSISGAKLARNGAIVSETGGSANFTIQKGVSLPGSINITSSSHPDQSASYEATTINLSWEKASGVTGFSYLLDDSADTTPPQTVTSADTSATYENQAVGTHYFHIRAQNADGWGAASHFTINIKEPEPKVDETLPAPLDIKIIKDSTFTSDIASGKVSGILITGKILQGYTANLIFSPVLTLPEGKTLSIASSGSGDFEYLVDYPIDSGFYKLVIQGQKDKTLTPKSEEIPFEISLAKGGSVNILSEADAAKNSEASSKKFGLDMLKNNYIYIIIGALVVLIAVAVLLIIKRRRIQTPAVHRSEPHKDATPRITIDKLLNKNDDDNSQDNSDGRNGPEMNI